MESKLLFINKGISSDKLTQSTAKERVKIFSHVQTKRRLAEARQAASRKPYSTYAYAASTSASIEASDAETDDSHDQFDDARSRFSRSPSVFPSTSGPLVTVFPSNNSVDPFHATAVSMDAGTHALLRCVFSRAACPNILAESFAPPDICRERQTTRHDAIIQKRLQTCVEDSTLMYCTLAYGSSLLAWHNGRAASENDRPLEYLIGQAVQQVRHCLSGPIVRPVDNWLLLSIYCLAVTELWNGSPCLWTDYPCRRAAMAKKTSSISLAACRTHLRALVNVVEGAGGWTMFDPYVLDSALLADKFLAITHENPPLIPLTWDPGPLPKDMQPEASVQADQEMCFLGVGFAETPISPRLREVIRGVIQYCQAAERLWSSDSVSPDQEGWLYRRLQALIHRFLVIHSESNALDRYVCLAACIFLLICTNSTSPILGAQQLARRLAEETIKPDTPWARGLEFWAMCTAAMIPRNFPEKQTYIERVRGLGGSKLSEGELFHSLGLFLFLPARQEKMVADLVDCLAVSV